MRITLALITVAMLLTITAEAVAQTAPIALPDLIAKGGQVKGVVQGPSIVGVPTNNLYVEHQKKLYVCRVAFWANMRGNPVRAASEDADVNVCWAME